MFIFHPIKNDSVNRVCPVTLKFALISHMSCCLPRLCCLSVVFDTGYHMYHGKVSAIQKLVPFRSMYYIILV